MRACRDRSDAGMLRSAAIPVNKVVVLVLLAQASDDHADATYESTGRKVSATGQAIKQGLEGNVAKSVSHVVIGRS
ncbi:hypothetical protein GCM10027199_84420 [Amycolatopsis magusensis]